MHRWVLAAGAGLSMSGAWAACLDNVVLVHGNSGAPSDFDNTYSALLARGYSAGQIFRPSWGSTTCAACNDHSGTEETPVESALRSAISSSCTGKIDVIGHSMGVTLAAKQILRFGWSSRVESFVGIAGGMRGLWSCGSYPFNVPTSTCGYYGLSVGSPFLGTLVNQKLGGRVTSIKSYYDQVVCATGVCTVGGVHASTLWQENATRTYTYGHFGLLTYTASVQASLIN
jgi:pimeloyl-ACP methyl ester carboxylesterase